MLANRERRDCLRKRRAEIRVLVAAVSRPPAGVHGQLEEVRETPDLLCAGGLAALERAELIEVHRLRTFRQQVRIEERGMTDLVVRIVRDVVRHVLIEDLDRRAVAGFRRVRACQLRVLLPQVGFE
jgi:hypothetical protein